MLRLKKIAKKEAMKGVSLVLFTCNCEKRIATVLKNILLQKTGIIKWELIIIDCGSSDKTLDITKTILSNSGIDFSIYSNDKMRDDFLMCVSHSKYDYISFIDDNCLIDVNWIKNSYYLLSNSDNCFFGSLNEPVFQSKKPKWFNSFMKYYNVGDQTENLRKAGNLYCVGITLKKTDYLLLRQLEKLFFFENKFYRSFEFRMHSLFCSLRLSSKTPVFTEMLKMKRIISLRLKIKNLMSRLFFYGRLSVYSNAFYSIMNSDNSFDISFSKSWLKEAVFQARKLMAISYSAFKGVKRGIILRDFFETLGRFYEIFKLGRKYDALLFEALKFRNSLPLQKHDFEKEIFGYNIYKNFRPVKSYDVSGWNSQKKYFGKIIKLLKPSLIIEVGSWKGASAIYMADIIKKNDMSSQILCIDTWLGSIEHWEDKKNTLCLKNELMMRHGYPSLYYQFLSNVLRKEHEKIITPFPATSQNAFLWLKNHSVKCQLIYIDGSHEFSDVYNDLCNYYSILDNGCVIMGDDYFSGFEGVRKAVDKFCAEQNIKPLLIQDDNLWVIKKPV